MSLEYRSTDPLAVEVADVIHRGDVARLEQLLAEHPGFARARFVDEKGVSRTALHHVADWPGHFPNGPQTVALLIRAGADPGAAVLSAHLPHHETPLHGAASSNDVAVLDALLDGGADIEAPGAVFTNGTAMSDAVIFANWAAARRLLERGANTTLSQASALGLLDRVQAFFHRDAPPGEHEIAGSFWHACRAGQKGTAAYLLQQGARLNWLGWDHKTPLDCAIESGNQDLIAWLREMGAKSFREASI